jgi:hypothetical protein
MVGLSTWTRYKLGIEYHISTVCTGQLVRFDYLQVVANFDLYVMPIGKQLIMIPIGKKLDHDANNNLNTTSAPIKHLQVLNSSNLNSHASQIM